MYVYLPLPPSVNHCYIPIRRRQKGSNKTITCKILSPAAKKWTDECIYNLKINKKIPEKIITGECMCLYKIVFPDNRRRDVTNYRKLADDLLVKANVIKDDSQIVYPVGPEIFYTIKADPGIYMILKEVTEQYKKDRDLIWTHLLNDESTLGFSKWFTDNI